MEMHAEMNNKLLRIPFYRNLEHEFFPDQFYITAVVLYNCVWRITPAVIMSDLKAVLAIVAILVNTQNPQNTIT